MSRASGGKNFFVSKPHNTRQNTISRSYPAYQKIFYIFSKKFKKALDILAKVCYNNIQKGGNKLSKKIKELTETLKQVDKLLTQILKVLITLGTIWAVIKGTFF